MPEKELKALEIVTTKSVYIILEFIDHTFSS